MVELNPAENDSYKKALRKLAEVEEDMATMEISDIDDEDDL